MILDQVGNNNGCLKGNAHISNESVGGYSATSIYLDGINSYILFGDIKALNFNIGDEFSISSWFKTSNADGAGVIISKMKSRGIGYQLMMDYATGRIIFEMVYGPGHFRIDSIDSFNDNYWHNAIIACNKGELHIYIDGSKIETKIVSNTLRINIQNDACLKIGSGYGSSLWKGHIDEVATFNISLNEAQVSKIYNRGATCNITYVIPKENIVNYWYMGDCSSFDESSGKMTYIMSGIDTGFKEGLCYHTWKTAEPPNDGSAFGKNAPPFGGPLKDIHVSSKYKVK